MSGIVIHDESISYDILKHSEITVKDSYFQRALIFCQQFLNGSPDFKITTSGSTGNPVTTVLTRRQLLVSAQQTILTLGLEKGFKALVCISTDHIGGKMMLVRGMEAKMDLYLTKPEAEINHLNLPAIDFMALVPLQVRSLLKTIEGRKFLASCKIVIIGGAAIAPELAKQLSTFNNSIYHTYGMTETASHIALKRLNGKDKQEDFHLLPGINITIDPRGCLVVNGEITNNKDLITNDIVEVIDKNRLRWLGRWDRVINTGAYKVFPEKIAPLITPILKSNNHTGDFIILGMPHEKWGQQVTLVLESTAKEESYEAQLTAQCKRVMHPYEVPKRIRYLVKFPRTQSGKIDVPKLMRSLAVIPDNEN